MGEKEFMPWTRFTDNNCVVGSDSPRLLFKHVELIFAEGLLRTAFR